MSIITFPAELVIAKDAEFIVDKGDTVILYDDGMGISYLGDGTFYVFEDNYTVVSGATLILDVASLPSVDNNGTPKDIEVLAGGTIQVGTGGRPYTVRTGALYKYRVI